jgi:hypothetical protein
VKDQYVGDINDFEKYAILRALQGASQLPLVICWMLTAPDETGEGAKIDYLGKLSRYRHLDPHAFDCLAAVVRSGERSTRAIEAVGVLEGAHFVSNRLGDDHGSRAALFGALWDEAAQPSLLFFDPDIGLAGKSVRKGGRRSAMYLFHDELAEAFGRGHSPVVYQHFAREQRPAYLRRAFANIRAAFDPPALFGLWSSRVAFLVVPQRHIAAALAGTARELASRWAPLLAFADEEGLTAATSQEHAREISLVVSGYPPTKNEAKSLLSDGHAQLPRVRMLLERAGEALARGAEPLGTARLGLELVVCGPSDAPSDATNYLGGVGEVLQEKSGRGPLQHLGRLADVSLFTNDRQIRHISYKEERAPEQHYRLRLWLLDGKETTARPSAWRVPDHF